MSAPPSTPPRAGLGSTGLAFARGDGPLVAVCGLGAGSGATTLALALARGAAAESSAPVLLCALDPADDRLAARVGAASGRSLAELARGVEAMGAPFATLEDGLRVIATTARAALPAQPDELSRALGALRRAHGLTVVDAGRLDDAAAPALAAATHVVWTAAAEPPALAAVTRLAHDPPPAAAPLLASELLALVATRPAHDPPPLRELAEQAAIRCRRLVLVPHDPQLTAAPRRADSRTALAAIGTFLDASR
ncbi:MAG TPA: hypothetical protein VN635_01200 [Conexibacter sp.]|nr:hypothetical protein [Conexibacter sp.]